MSMTNTCIRRFAITVDDRHLGVPRMNAQQTFMVDIEEVESGGKEFGYASDKGYGVRCNGLAISCNSLDHAKATALLMVRNLVAATMRLGPQSPT